MSLVAEEPLDRAAANGGAARPALTKARPSLSFRRFVECLTTKALGDRWAAGRAVSELEAHGHFFVSVEKAALSTIAGATGGFLVTPELRYDVFKDVGEEAVVRRFATVVPMTTSEVLLPRPDAQTAATAGLPPYFGTMAGVWTEEGLARTESDPLVRQLAVRAWELSWEVLVSNALLQDAPAAEALLRKLIGRAVAWLEDHAFLRGDGVAKPRGMLDASLAVTRSGSNAFADADARGMVEKLLPSSWPNAIWVAHPSVMVKMPQLAGWCPNASREPARGPAGTLHELPIWVSDKLPALGTAGDVLLCDPTYYAIGDRGLLIDASEHPLFRTNQTVFRVVARVGGQPWLSGPVTLADGTKTAHAYVSLTT